MRHTREVRHEGVHAQYAIRRPAPGVVVLALGGWDVGEFGDAPMQELAKDLEGGGPVELFVDARDVKGASIEVSSEWARWLRANRSSLRQISMLTGSRYIQVTADFVRRFADLGDMMRIYTAPAAFDAALEEASGERSS